MAGKYKLKVDQGATFRRIFFVEFVQATPTWNLTGYTARMQIRTTVTSDQIVLTASTANGMIVITPPTQIALTIQDEATALIPAAVYVYDLEIESPLGEVIRLLQGSVVVNAEVTR